MVILISMKTSYLSCTSADCRKTFRNQSSLDSHIQKEHSEGEGSSLIGYRCKKCKRVLVSFLTIKKFIQKWKNILKTVALKKKSTKICPVSLLNTKKKTEKIVVRSLWLRFLRSISSFLIFLVKFIAFCFIFIFWLSFSINLTEFWWVL